MDDLVEGLFPAGRIHLLGGAAGAGKTTLMAWMLKKMQEGEELFGQPSRAPRGGIYYIAADQQWEDYAKVIEKSGLRIEDYYSFADDLQMSHKRFSAPDPLPLLKFAVDQINPRPDSVVVIDIFGLFLGKDLRAYRDIMGFMWEYSRWCKDRQITIFGSVHAGKQKTGDKERYVRLFDRVMGGGPMRGACSTACYLASKEETGIELGFQQLEITPRLAPSLMVQMVWTSTGLLVPLEGIPGAGLDENRKILLLIPEAEPGLRTEEICALARDHHKLSRTKVYDILSYLKGMGLVRKISESERSGYVKVVPN